MTSAAPNGKTVPALYVSDFECCGCAACASVCPRGAIVMCPNRYGFLYPRVDENACIGCRLCLKVCAFKQDLTNLCQSNML